MEDASQAMRNMNGKGISGEQIRVDYLRSHPTRRVSTLYIEFRNNGLILMTLRDGPFSGRMGSSDSHSMAKRPHPQLGGRKGDGQPSNVLWVGYPPSLRIDEQMLHNAMILFGEIERIKSFPSRHYAFVEFRSVEEARRAKEGLQGRLFNDPRITIMFSSSGLAPGKEYSGFYSGIKGPMPYMVFSDHASTPSQDADPKNLIGPNWRRPSPHLPSGQGFRPPIRQTSGSWDVYDANQFQRDAKRSRIDTSLPIDDASFPMRKIDDLGPGTDHSYWPGPVFGSAGSGPFAKGRLSPVLVKGTAGGLKLAHSDGDFIWRGIIARGGTPVYHARCVPIGRGIETELPEVVNCSARTGLDMLAKHYREAIGFDIVFFLPDSEDDFASYTEFLRYLGSKNRAGVAKFDDGTRLFLVPPSDFLTKVLKVVGPERLYGVVLKLPPELPNATSLQPHPSLLSQPDYSLSHLTEEQALQMDYGRVLPEDSKPPARPTGQAALQSQLPSEAGALSKVLLSRHLLRLLHLKDLLRNIGMMHGVDGSGLYGAPGFQQPNNLNASNQIHGANVSQPQNVMQADRKNLEQLQCAFWSWSGHSRCGG
ncbi:hypothetical protein CCACVL1_25230 [Corchorus capsularis]|uniref:RRM domain-containing protein n=1 Tax=Corchorus capsularis TaxID=210143 RepID=A0A1R3GLK2_COCAP|nr:hypothetical protein CCACVL1_25230 [Corchorus capsularis]